MLALIVFVTLWSNWGNTEEAHPTPPTQVVVPPSPWIVIEATAYTKDCRGCIGITRDGTVADHRKMIVAADPRYYPLGTEVEVEFPDGTIRRYTVRDTGGAIKGPHRLDILMGSYTEAINWGRRDIRIRVVGGSNSP